MTTVIGQASGAIGVAGDNDWFKVQLTAGTQYVFDIGNGTLSNTQVSLYDSTGKLIVSGTDGNPAGGGQIVYEATTSGTFFVGASAIGDSTGTYTITQAVVPYDFAGNTTTTGLLNIGGQVTGTLSVGGQQDWFKVTLTAGQAYSFNVSGLGAGQVTIYNASGKAIASGDDNNTLAGNSVVFVPTASGTYFIGATDTQSGTGAFTLSGNTATVDFAGNVNTTGTVAVGGSVTGAITNVGQSDWFKVTLTAGTEYVFDVAASSGGLSPSATLYDSNGNALVSGFSGGPNGAARTSFEPTVTGTYYVGAAGIISTTGGFTVNVSTATPDFLGNTTTQGTVGVGGHVSGTIGVAGQQDWFKVTLNAGNEYVLTAGGGTLNANVALYDASGNILVNGNGGTASYEPTATGTYYVAANGLNSSVGTFTVGVSTATYDHPGNTLTPAVAPVNGTATGNITTFGQHDWFKVTMNAGTTYAISVGNGTLGAPEAALYDSTGKLIIASTDDGSGGVSLTSFTPTATGTYYVGAWDQQNGTGTFSVAVSIVTGDDIAGNTSTTGVLTTALTAATAVTDYQAKLLTSPVIVADTAANVQANLDGLQAAVAGGKIATITLTDGTTPTLTVTAAQIYSDQATLQDINSAYTLNITGYSTAMSQFVAGQHDRYTPGTSHPGVNQAVEISSIGAGASAISLGSAFNVVILDGDHSTTPAAAGQPDSYSFNVDANGKITLHDNNTGFNQTVSGATYLIFDAGAQNPDTSYQSIYFVGGATTGQVTSLYNAAFLRQPDLAGLEYYAGPIGSGSLSLHQTALFFLASPEFQNDYPTASLPTDHGGPNDQAFINTLYNNVLHRSPAAFEVSFYANELAAGTIDRATMLEDFALSPENQSNIVSFNINTSNGAYADSNDLLPASTVLNELTSGANLNLAAVDPTSVSGSVTVGGITLTSGTVTLSSTANPEIVTLSASFNTAIIQNSGSTVVDSSSASTINLSGANNTTLSLVHGGTDTVELLGGTNTTIQGFTPGGNTNLIVANTTTPSNIQIIDGTQSKVLGSSLSFGSGSVYVINVGTVTDGSAATAAAAANKAYQVADVNGTGTATGAGEFITFLATDASGNTQVWFWGSTAGVTNGIIPTSSLAAGADVNNNHLVDANELTHIATISGVAAGSLSIFDLS